MCHPVFIQHNIACSWRIICVYLLWVSTFVWFANTLPPTHGTHSHHSLIVFHKYVIGTVISIPYSSWIRKWILHAGSTADTMSAVEEMALQVRNDCYSKKTNIRRTSHFDSKRSHTTFNLLISTIIFPAKHIHTRTVRLKIGIGYAKGWNNNILIQTEGCKIRLTLQQFA